MITDQELKLSGLWKSTLGTEFMLVIEVLSVADGHFKARIHNIEGSTMIQIGTDFMPVMDAVFPRQPCVRLHITECETPTLTEGCIIRGEILKTSKWYETFQSAMTINK